MSVVPPQSGKNRRKKDDSMPSIAPMSRDVPRGPASSRNVASRAPVAPAAPEARRLFSPERKAKAVALAKSAFGGLLIVSLSVGMALGARRYVKTSPRFAVTDIVVTGTHRRSPEEIANVAELTTGVNIFGVDTGRARTRVLSDPWVKDATVEKKLPGKIAVAVIEKEPAVLVASGETYLYTRDGQPIKALEARDPSDFPIVTGLSAQTLVDDREGAARMIKGGLDFAESYERTGLGQRAPVEEIHYEKDGAMSVVVGKSGTVLALGHAPFKRKLDQAVRIFAELDRRGQKPDTLYLDNEAHPERVVVRMR
jgi:cell division protein FtsQ